MGRNSNNPGAAVAAALRELVARCDGAEGVRADGSNVDTRAAHAALDAWRLAVASDSELLIEYFDAEGHLHSEEVSLGDSFFRGQMQREHTADDAVFRARHRGVWYEFAPGGEPRAIPQELESLNWSQELKIPTFPTDMKKRQAD